MTESVITNRNKVAQATTWQSYDNSIHTSSKTIEENNRRRNLRRKAVAEQRAWDRAWKEDNRDSSGHLRRPRVSTCGCALHNRGSIDVVSGEEKPHAKGLMYCENAKECPVCSEIIGRARESEINQAIKIHMDNNGGVLLVTFTVRHHKGQTLKSLQELLTNSFTKMTGSRRYRRLAEEYGFVGRIRCYEVTHGCNGWHPHFHAVVMTERPLTGEETDSLCDLWKVLWMHCVEKSGGYANYDNGIDIQVANDVEAVGSYLAKELTNAADAKDGRGSVHPFQLLDEDSPESVRLWNEYVTATKGKHSICWSRGLRDRLGMTGTKTDSQIIEEEEKKPSVLIGNISVEIWNEIRTDGVIQEQAMEAISAHDYEYAAAILGCSYMVRPIDGVPIPMFFLSNERRRVKYADS